MTREREKNENAQISKSIEQFSNAAFFFQQNQPKTGRHNEHKQNEKTIRNAVKYLELYYLKPNDPKELPLTGEKCPPGWAKEAAAGKYQVKALSNQRAQINFQHKRTKRRFLLNRTNISNK